MEDEGAADSEANVVTVVVAEEVGEVVNESKAADGEDVN